MHELLLFGQIPSQRHTQLLNVLAGISAMQPQPILEKHLVFKPNRKPGSGAQKHVGGAQDIQKAGSVMQAAGGAGDLFYLQLVAEVVEKERGKAEGVDGSSGGDRDGDEEDVKMQGVENGEASTAENGNANAPTAASAPSSPIPTPSTWTLQFRDLPDAARHRPVTSRLIADTPLISGSPLAFMTSLDYSHTNSYILHGHRFTHNSISLLLFQLLQSPSTTPNSELLSTSVDLSEARKLDTSGAWTLQASVRVQDGSKVEIMNKGMQELLGLKELLKGCVELEAAERLALDTRVR